PLPHPPAPRRTARADRTSAAGLLHPRPVRLRAAWPVLPRGPDGPGRSPHRGRGAPQDTARPAARTVARPGPEPGCRASPGPQLPARPRHRHRPDRPLPRGGCPAPAGPVRRGAERHRQGDRLSSARRHLGPRRPGPRALAALCNPGPSSAPVTHPHVERGAVIIPRLHPRAHSPREPLAEALGRPLSPNEGLTEYTVGAHWPGLDYSTPDGQQRTWTSVEWAEHLEDPYLEQPFAA